MVADTTNLPLFLLSVFAISTTGAMMPGPVTALTVAQGSQRRNAGALIAIGHGMIELPVILLIYFGLASFMDLDPVRVSVGIIGGAVLLWMALGLFRNTPSVVTEQKGRAQGSLLGGLALTLANPYFKNPDGSLKTFDFVVANPPFSNKAWSTGLDPANDEYTPLGKEV